MDNREQMESLAAEAEWQQQQARGFQEQLQNLQNIELELDRTAEALKNLKEKQAGLFNLSSGVFVNAELRNINKLLVNVGAGVLVEKDIDGTLQFLNERKKEVGDARNELMKGMQTITSRLREIDVEARKLIEEERRRG